MLEKGKALVPETIFTCTCCEKPEELKVAHGTPWALCPATKTVYEIQKGKVPIKRSDLEVVGEAKIVESGTGKQVFPVPAPSTDELLNQTRDESAGEKEPGPTPRTGVKVDDADYY